MSKPFIALIGAGLFFVSFQACSNSGSGKAVDDSPKVSVEAGPPDSGGGIAAFNGNCTTTRWAGFSDACWSCLCGTCKDTLNACDDDCIGILECAKTNHTLVNIGKQIDCELTATGTLCTQDKAAQAAAGPLTSLDTCLISAPSKTGFRACETECGIQYTGDVCKRFGIDAGAGSN